MFKILVKYLNTLKKQKYRIEIHTPKEKEILDKMFRFRYQVYCLVDKLLDKNNYPNKKESDEFDDKSVFILAFNKKNEVLGMVRIIYNSSLGFPTEEEFSLEKNLDKYNKDKMVELSRLIVRPDYRNTLLLYDLYKAALFYSKQNGVKYWLGCVEEWFLKSLKKIMGDIDIPGKPIFCFNAMNYPFVLKVKEVESKIKSKNKLLYFFIKKKSDKFKF